MNKLNIMELLNRLYRVTGFRISIHDRSGKELAASPEYPHMFCHCLHEDSLAHRRCQESDQEAFRRAAETGTLFVYRCPFGLYEAVCPLYRYGALAGFLMMGQVHEAGESMEDALRHTTGHGDPAKLKIALSEIPEYTREKIEACAEIMAVFAEYMSLTDAFQSPAEDLPSKVRAYLNAHYADAITIASLCAVFAVSRTTLLNRYRDRYGETVTQTLIRIRITQAQKLLIDTSLPISEVAYRCGYSDPVYFAKAYRKCVGVPPTATRQGR